MRYESDLTPKNNCGISYISQEAANEQAKQMDDNNCTGCTDCTGCLKWDGPPAEALLSLNGGIYSVSTNGKYIQIGCQNHSVKEWENSTLQNVWMTLERWKLWKQWKPTILAMVAYRASQN